MSDTVIRVENLGKKYTLAHQQEGERYRALRDVLADKAKSLGRHFKPQSPLPTAHSPSQEEFWALKDVSFEIKQGDRVGIIGRNGAGKSTLLKILSRITDPTEGRINIKGRVASLLEVGTGFHPELTGRENIFLNGAILGMSREEIKRKFDEIVDFAEVERFLDTPVKRYSSGMYVRLAFAVAAYLEPEILIVDEVLAVGDAQFQKKCLGKMKDVSSEGRTILFVSHNMTAIRVLCNKGILLSKGQLKREDDIQSVIQHYLAANYHQSLLFSPEKPVYGDGIALIEAQLVCNEDKLENGKAIDVKFKVKLLKRQLFSTGIFVYREGDSIFYASDFHQPLSHEDLDIGLYEITFKIPPYLLNPGLHSIGIMFGDYYGNERQLLNVSDVLSFELEDDGYRRNNKYMLGWRGGVSPILQSNIRHCSD